MEKKTKDLKVGDVVLNIIDHKYYPFESKESFGKGYIITLSPSHLGGNQYYCEYADCHTIKQPN